MPARSQSRFPGNPASSNIESSTWPRFGGTRALDIDSDQHDPSCPAFDPANFSAGGAAWKTAAENRFLMATSKKTSKKAGGSKTAGAKTKPKSAAKAKPAAATKASAKSKAKSKSRAEAVAHESASSSMSPAKTVVERPAKPAKPAVDAQWQADMREALAAQRQRLLTVVQTTQAQMAQKSGDLADVSDRASEGFEDELDMGLMAIEAAQLDDIEAAIKRIDDGTYGICLTCAKAVPRKRLEVLPFARRCLPCEGEHERRAKNIEPSDEEEDWD
ncbi:MAG: hypothetical protein B6D36_04840 [Planctomycetes bacterium UTPLA1]|nr:MAG: hypothetical protein B6D36_04840 [Planctomycetes bacterium UTPLA1]